jgi:branched-chain amino acid transport system ATP-binding protein
MLRLERLSCGYGAIRAVEDVSLDVPAGTVLALLGPNGAGKTSTIMAVMGHTTVHGGRIMFEDRDITNAPAVGRAPLGIALVPEGRRLFSDLTVEENLTVGGYCRSAARDAVNRAQVYELFPRLRDRRKQVAGSLSGGEQQMLAMGRALMAEPRLLLIDELSLGLMPKMVDQCFDALARLRRGGMTIVLVEQNTARALDFADSVAILSSGLLVFTGPAAAARADAALFEAYLGRVDRGATPAGPAAQHS